MKPLILLSLFLAQTPWKAPYQALEIPSEPGKYIDLMKDQQEKVLLEGDTISFLYKSKQDTVQLVSGLSLPVKKIPNTDVWIAQAKMAGWDKAFFNYSFVDGGLKSGTQLQMKLWRGANAPQEPKEAAELQGTVKTYTVKSTVMGEDRSVMVYLPPNAPKGLPAVYLADGGACSAYAKVLEPLILEKKVRPVALIGVFSGTYKGDRDKPYDPQQDFRAKEYLKMVDQETYRKHLKFFCDEVVSWATKEFGLSNKREDRAVQGVSNGGAFATTASVDRPEVFGWAMPFSVAAYDRVLFKESVKGKALPKYFFAAGTLETFIRGTDDAHSILTENGAHSVCEHYTSGHDFVMWRIAFVKYLPQIFPAK